MKDLRGEEVSNTHLQWAAQPNSWNPHTSWNKSNYNRRAMLVSGNVTVCCESKQSSLCFDESEVHSVAPQHTPPAASLAIFAAIELSALHIVLHGVIQLHQQVAPAFWRSTPAYHFEPMG